MEQSTGQDRRHGGDGQHQEHPEEPQDQEDQAELKEEHQEHQEEPQDQHQNEGFTGEGLGSGGTDSGGGGGARRGWWGWAMQWLWAAVSLILLAVKYPRFIVQQIAWVLVGRRREIARLQAAKAAAVSFHRWQETAMAIDRISGGDDWKKYSKSRFYDSQLISQRLAFLRETYQVGDVNEIMFHLRAGMLRNFGGICHPRLYTRTCFGTKTLIEDYSDEVTRLLEFLSRLEEDELAPMKKLEFFSNAYHTFGRTALILHGTVAFALFQLGIVKSLHERNLLPKVLCGTAAGALVAAIVCCHTNEELPRLFQKDGINFDAFSKRSGRGRFWRRLKRLLKHGVLMDIRVLEKALYDNIGHMTFEEAFQKTGRVLNITLQTSSKNGSLRLLNHLNAPTVVIWTAACASCSVIGLYEQVDLLSKSSTGDLTKWNPDGVTWTGLAHEGDLQITRLSELFFVNHFIVSRVLPYETPFGSFTMRDGGVLVKIRRLIFSEFEHRIKQMDELGLLPASIRSLLVFQQGDINIVPSISFKDYFYLFNLPPGDMIQYCILQGERATWPLVSLMKTRMGIEKQLEAINDGLRRDREIAIAQRILEEEEDQRRRAAQNRVERRKSNQY